MSKPQERQPPPRERSPFAVRRDMSRMMALFGLDPQALPLGSVAELCAAVDRCEACATASHCQAVLAGALSDAPGHFCPNSRLFARLGDEVRRRDGLD